MQKYSLKLLNKNAEYKSFKNKSITNELYLKYFIIYVFFTELCSVNSSFIYYSGIDINNF